MTTLYHDSPFAVRDDLDAAHRKILAGFSRPGTWWSGPERAALAAEVRAARSDAGVQDAAPVPDGIAALPDVAKRMVRRVALATPDLERSVFDDAIADGLSEEAYVEAVGITTRTTNIDDFARGLGIAMRTLPPIEAGEPSRVRPAEAVGGEAWVPMVPSGEAGGAVAERLYGKDWTANILRALSLVPDEAESIIDLEEVEYRSVKTIMDFNFSHDPAIARPQVELIAARISALNACFY